MIKKVLFIILHVLLYGGQLAYADVEVTFVESAPKDRFEIKNTSECVLKDLVLNVDLSNSAGRLIFDTSATGAGVEVFQPFEVVKGKLTLISSTTVKDGDKTLSLSIESIEPNKSASFSIDVDDTLAQSELGNIRVSGSEISNGLIAVNLKNKKPYKATFNKNGKALIKLPPCSA
ncbi:hypothetical protein OO007_16565 [Cocleimonas sp. KMM 6892]|uniref:hypothetical protein n=1 Tax=unclassified Cocleimonas TaxID=2639732 RepID=UPI002DB5E87C|nr:MULTISPECIES: hypothetical protein [unclassified Cocleimonas]MEB8433852.1 hypothetical protein [Cocleimonas sp. KMM 6892]MEC4716663.1 hypothetical protein [Cocleimonas sp. KMM 6895]MEC4746182.1 hypothetical protein [Cocleimonas sp. KMM 6896]